MGKKIDDLIPISSKITRPQICLVFQKHALAKNKTNTRVSHNWSFVREMSSSLMDSCHKVPLMRKVFPCHDVIMRSKWWCRGRRWWRGRRGQSKCEITDMALLEHFHFLWYQKENEHGNVWNFRRSQISILFVWWLFVFVCLFFHNFIRLRGLALKFPLNF